MTFPRMIEASLENMTNEQPHVANDRHDPEKPTDAHKERSGNKNAPVRGRAQETPSSYHDSALRRMFTRNGRGSLEREITKVKSKEESLPCVAMLGLHTVKLQRESFHFGIMEALLAARS